MLTMNVPRFSKWQFSNNNFLKSGSSVVREGKEGRERVLCARGIHYQHAP